jgi:hypothetical protein
MPLQFVALGSSASCCKRSVIADKVIFFFYPPKSPGLNIKRSAQKYNPNPRRMRHHYLGLFFPMEAQYRAN